MIPKSEISRSNTNAPALSGRGCVKILAYPLFVTCCKTYNKASTFPSGGFVMSKSFSNFVTIKKIKKLLVSAKTFFCG